MKVARLNVRIEIQKNTVSTDRYGNRMNTWIPYLSCYATVSGEAPQEDTDAGLTVDDSRADFTIRWCNAASVLTSTGYRVLYRDEVYDIIGVNHMNCRNRAVKLLCKRERQ